MCYIDSTVDVFNVESTRRVLLLSNSKTHTGERLRTTTTVQSMPWYMLSIYHELNN